MISGHLKFMNFNSSNKYAMKWQQSILLWIKDTDYPSSSGLILKFFSFWDIPFFIKATKQRVVFCLFVCFYLENISCLEHPWMFRFHLKNFRFRQFLKLPLFPYIFFLNLRRNFPCTDPKERMSRNFCYCCLTTL